MAGIHQRRQDTCHIGNNITNPDIDFAKVAQGLGVWAEGPVTDPSKIGPALKRALAEVKNGRPALVDVVTQGR
jgi:acetolactate synthase-1/2/3 large subunit